MDRSSAPDPGGSQGRQTTAERQNRYRRGYWAEYIAAAYLIAKGYRILARRFKTPAGEIDVIAIRGGRVAFIEVKHRATRGDCEAAVTPRLRQRVRRAADLWLAKRPHYQGLDLGFDLVFIVPRSWPIHLRDAL